MPINDELKQLQQDVKNMSVVEYNELYTESLNYKSIVYVEEPSTPPNKDWKTNDERPVDGSQIMAYIEGCKRFPMLVTYLDKQEVIEGDLGARYEFSRVLAWHYIPILNDSEYIGFMRVFNDKKSKQAAKPERSQMVMKILKYISVGDKVTVHTPRSKALDQIEEFIDAYVIDDDTYGFAVANEHNEAWWFRRSDGKSYAAGSYIRSVQVINGLD